MAIEFTFKTITIQSDQIEEQYPFLISELGLCLPIPKTSKRRKRKRKNRTVGSLINEIIDSL